MSLLSGLMNNKGLLNAASSLIRDAFMKDGVSAIIMTSTGDDTGDIPGIKVQPMKEAFAIVTGQELTDMQQLRETYEDVVKTRDRLLDEVQELSAECFYLANIDDENKAAYLNHIHHKIGQVKKEGSDAV